MKFVLIRRLVSTGVLLSLLIGLSLTTSAGNVKSGDDAKPVAIRVTPPAPVFDESARLTELAERRTRVAKSIGTKAMLLLFSTEPRVYTNDVDYPYRQENNLFYLTNLKQSSATLVLMPGNADIPEVLFLPARNPSAETWTGHMYSVEEASRISGIKEIWDARELDPFLKAISNHQTYRPTPERILMQKSPGIDAKQLPTAGRNESEIYLLIPRDPDSLEYRVEQRMASEWSKPASGYTVKNAMPIFAEMRLRKSPMELKLLQHAIDITTEAQQRAWLAAPAAKWEYEVDAQVIYTFKLRNADNWGYPSIVGCGNNATTLHYTESQGPVKAGDLLLMDVGAEYAHYTADVTRTIPANGKFSPAQAELYQIVYDAQEAGAAVIKPGARISDVHRAASQVIKEGLFKLGLITDRNSNQFLMWFMHGTSHWLGMNVHDVGSNATPFEPGMVFTNEPGIYIRPDALDYMPQGWSQEKWDKYKATIAPAFEKYKGMGVRIEDDMLVTSDGVRWMTEALPRKITDIEQFMAQAKN